MPKIKCPECRGEGCEACEGQGEREMHVPFGFRAFKTKFGWGLRRAR